MAPSFETVVASAPGKVILFGEHAVVYGVTAIAAALSDLRIEVKISGTTEDLISVNLEDIVVGPDGASFSRQITLGRVRELFTASSAADALSPVDPDESILEKLRTDFDDAPLAAAQGMMAIVYLVAKVAPEFVWHDEVSRGGMQINVKSDRLPIGAGLGSSAAFSVALSAALLRLRHEQEPYLSSGAVTPSSGSQPEVSSSGCPPVSLLPIINGWAYAAEVVIHGSPSGLDNTTSCYGGAVRFRKGEDKFDKITNNDLPKMRILLTNTRVPRSTKQLVADVRTKHDALPDVVKPILESIEGISMRFLEMIDESKARKERDMSEEEAAEAAEKEAAQIAELFRTNQHLLCALGVSHPSLSQVVEASALQGLSCKLTGAGGGGCAITLLPVESSQIPSPVGAGGESDRSPVALLNGALEALGFETFESSLAGRGVLWP